MKQQKRREKGNRIMNTHALFTSESKKLRTMTTWAINTILICTIGIGGITCHNLNAQSQAQVLDIPNPQTNGDIIFRINLGPHPYPWMEDFPYPDFSSSEFNFNHKNISGITFVDPLKLTISIGDAHIVWYGEMKIPAANDNTTQYIKDFHLQIDIDRIQQTNSGDIVNYGTGYFSIGDQRWEPLTAQYFQTQEGIGKYIEGFTSSNSVPESNNSTDELSSSNNLI